MGKIKILFFTLCFLNIAILSAESRAQNRQSAPAMHQRISQDSIKSTENAISLEKPTQKIKSTPALAEGFSSDFLGYQGGGEQSYLVGSERADNADSQKSAGNPTQSLESYIALAKQNYPLYANTALLESAKNLSLEKINLHFIPHFKIAGKASYQSDVTTLPFPQSVINNFGISYTPLTRDQYQSYVELTQPLLDMNALSQKHLINAQFATQKIENDKELYHLQQNIITLYFSILLLEEQKKQNLLHQKELAKNYAHLQNLRKQGIINADSLDRLQMEMLKIQKLSSALTSQEDSARFMLATFTRLEPASLVVSLPDFEKQKRLLQEMSALAQNLQTQDSMICNKGQDFNRQDSSAAAVCDETGARCNSKISKETLFCDEKCGLQEKSQGILLDINECSDFSPLPHLSRKAELLLKERPELQYFTAKSYELSAQKQAQNAKYYPYIDAFIQAGYANPGLNFLKGGFQPYYIAGVRFSWDLSPLYSHSNQNQMRANLALRLEKGRDTFVLHNKMALIEGISKAQNLLSQIEENQKILALSEKILKAQEARLKNGTLSVNDYLSEANNATLARIQEVYSRIEFVAEVYRLRQILNRF